MTYSAPPTGLGQLFQVRIARREETRNRGPKHAAPSSQRRRLATNTIGATSMKNSFAATVFASRTAPRTLRAGRKTYAQRSARARSLASMAAALLLPGRAHRPLPHREGAARCPVELSQSLWPDSLAGDGSLVLATKDAPPTKPDYCVDTTGREPRGRKQGIVTAVGPDTFCGRRSPDLETPRCHSHKESQLPSSWVTGGNPTPPAQGPTDCSPMSGRRCSWRERTT